MKRFYSFFLCALMLTVFCTFAGCSASNELSRYLTGDKQHLYYQGVTWGSNSQTFLQEVNLSEEQITRHGDVLVTKEPFAIKGVPLSPIISCSIPEEQGLYEVRLVFLSEQVEPCIETRNLILKRMEELSSPILRFEQPVSLSDAQKADWTEGFSCKANDGSSISVRIDDPAVNEGTGMYSVYLSISAGTV